MNSFVEHNGKEVFDVLDDSELSIGATVVIVDEPHRSLIHCADGRSYLFPWVSEMDEYCGMTAHIEAVTQGNGVVLYELDIDNGEWAWDKGCFSEVVYESAFAIPDEDDFSAFLKG